MKHIAVLLKIVEGQGVRLITAAGSWRGFGGLRSSSGFINVRRDGNDFDGGKSAIHLARVYGERKRNFVGQHFLARGYFVNTVGRDEDVIRAYIRNQEKEDQRLEQLNLWR